MSWVTPSRAVFVQQLSSTNYFFLFPTFLKGCQSCHLGLSVGICESAGPISYLVFDIVGGTMWPALNAGLSALFSTFLDILAPM